jgi:inhibitor of growth protein 3
MGNGSREGSHVGGRSVNATPVLSQSNFPAGKNGRSARVRATKRTRPEEDEEESDLEEEDRPQPRRGMTVGSGNGNGTRKAVLANDLDMAEEGMENTGGEGEVDSNTYCVCHRVSYGEMIGCDDDQCEIEWVSHPHLMERGSS